MKPLVVANWKMHKTPREAASFVRRFARALPSLPPCDVVVAPAFPLLPAVGAALRKARMRESLGAQDVFYEKEGAFTGEVSAAMLRDVGVLHVIVGHSERRRLFGETDAVAARKARAVIACGMTPIFCVGETWEERRAERTERALDRQLRALAGKPAVAARDIVVAYEPVWAIGTGRTATPADASAAHAFIAECCRRMLGAPPRRILYGGSVNEKNAAALLAAPFVGGLLVGGASLQPRTFARIASSAPRRFEPRGRGRLPKGERTARTTR